MLFRQTAAAALLSLISTTTAQNSVATVYRYVDSTATIYANYCPCPATVNGIVAPTSGASSGSSGSGAVAGTGSNAVGGGSGSSGTGSSGTGSSGTGSGSGAGVVVVPGSGSSGTGSSGLTPIAGGAPGFQIYISISVGVSVFVTAGVTSTVTTSTPVTITVPASTTGTGGAGVAPVQTSTTSNAPFGNGTTTSTRPSVSSSSVTSTTISPATPSGSVTVLPVTTGTTTSTSGTSVATITTTGSTTSTSNSASSTITTAPVTRYNLEAALSGGTYNTVGFIIYSNGQDGAAGLGAPDADGGAMADPEDASSSPDNLFDLTLPGSGISATPSFQTVGSVNFAYNPTLANAQAGGAPLYYNTAGSTGPGGNSQTIAAFTFATGTTDQQLVNQDYPDYTIEAQLPGYAFFLNAQSTLSVILSTDFATLAQTTDPGSVFFGGSVSQAYLFARPVTV